MGKKSLERVKNITVVYTLGELRAPLCDGVERVR
jgi:hypothetical protein